MSTLKPADIFPEITFKLVSGKDYRIADQLGHWVMLVVYRGDHCPRCKAYVAQLHALASSYAKRDVEILLATADTEPFARRTIEENGWTLPVAHSLSVAEMKSLSLYLTPRTDDSNVDEIDEPYAEPGLFIVNPEGKTQVIAISNSPSVRPDLDVVLDGIIGTQDRNLPIRGLYF